MTLGFDGTDMTVMGFLTVCAVVFLMGGTLGVLWLWLSKKEIANTGDDENDNKMSISR
jgi:hypothetical protein